MRFVAMIEYSLDIDLPDHVFDNEIIRAMSDATTDIMTWPNVSFKIFQQYYNKLIIFRTGRTCAHSTYAQHSCLYASMMT